jgi:hypothetical protein
MANGRLKTASFGPGFLLAVMLFCGFAVVAWLLFWFAAPTQTYEDQRAQNRIDKAAAIAKEAQQKLYSPPQWIDKAKGTVQLPIDTAMDLVVVDYQQKPVQPSQVKVEAPYPAGLQSPAAAAAPAVAAAGQSGTTGRTVVVTPAMKAVPSSSPEVKK